MKIEWNFVGQGRPVLVKIIHKEVALKLPASLSNKEWVETFAAKSFVHWSRSVAMSLSSAGSSFDRLTCFML